jgi:hypothetical protein
MRPEGGVRESGSLLERGRIGRREWPEKWREARGGDQVQIHTGIQVQTCGGVRTCGGGVEIDTEARGRWDSVDKRG